MLLRSCESAGLCFKLDRSWKEDVVLKMNMAMQILLELAQAVIKRSEGDAGTLWKREVFAQLSYLQHLLSGLLVVAHHAFNRPRYASKRGCRRKHAFAPRLLQSINV